MYKASIENPLMFENDDINSKLILDGQRLTIEDVYSVAYKNRKVVIKDEAKQRIWESRQFIYKLAKQDAPMYGFNRGVGWNKDKVIDPVFFEQFNRNLLLSHSAGVKPIADKAK